MKEKNDIFIFLRKIVLKTLGYCKEIIEIYKLETGKTRIKKRSVPVSEIVHAVVGKYMFIIGQKKIDFNLTLPKNELIIWADKGYIIKAIRSLLDNAVENTPEQGEIELSIEEQKDNILIAVRDTGQGIPPDKMNVVLGKFVKLGNGQWGLGMGLTIVNHIARVHGGKVSINCGPGGGSKIGIEIPI